MTLEIGETDIFEDKYRAKFREMAASQGLFINYEKDRAALDLGLHLMERRERGAIVADTRIWFQLKGIMSSTLSQQQFDQAASVKLSLQIEHLRQWYRSPEPVYLVVYIESLDFFLGDDVRSIVDRQWGDKLLHPTAFKMGQNEITVQISKQARVDETFWQRLHSHSSMRTDGQSHKGNPLAHRRDLLTDTLLRMEPVAFEELVNALLSEHRYKIEEVGDARPLYPDSQSAGDILSLTYGKMFTTYEWGLRLTSELIPDEDGFRLEGHVSRVQGPCAVIIHSYVASLPDIAALRDFGKQLVTRGIKHLLVFVNHHMFTSMSGDRAYCCLGEYSQGMGHNSVQCVPQHLEDLSTSVLATTNVYLSFRDKLLWQSDELREKLATGEWKILRNF